jgi:hypothetical protein
MYLDLLRTEGVEGRGFDDLDKLCRHVFPNFNLVSRFSSWSAKDLSMDLRDRAIRLRQPEFPLQNV